MTFSQDPIHTLENLIYKNKTKSFSIYLVVVLAILLFIALLPVIKVDISSQSRGMVRSTTASVPISSLVNGKVTYMAMANNKLVHQGDTLIKLTQETLDTERTTNQQLTGDTQSLLHDLSLVVRGNSTGLTTPAVQEEWYSYTSKSSELQSKIAQAKISYDRNKGLYDKGVIARTEYEKYSFDYTFAQQALASLDKNQKAQWQNKKQELQTQLKNLNGTLNKLTVEAKNYAITAPLSGTIENFSGVQTGSFLNAAQNIATLSPNDQLIVETSVSPNDIGLVGKNQKVKFQIDAFNYNQWGLLEGNVIDVDQNITLQDNQAFFKVRCKLNETTMQLKNGYNAKITKGMTLTTRFIITRRSLFDLLFDKVDDWLNPKTIKS